MKFGDYVQARLMELGMSHRELARLLGRSNSCISTELIKGESPPTPTWVERNKHALAAALELTPAHIEKAVAEARGEDGDDFLSLDRAILMALAEEEEPNEDMKLLLERTKAAAGFPLTVETYRAILKDFHVVRGI
jgi:IS30 family transposase